MDLLCLINRILQLRGFSTVDEGTVLDGRVRDWDRLGNKAADEAADYGRRRVLFMSLMLDANLVGVCNRWYPVVRHLHRFLWLLPGLVVNHDGGGGTAPDPLVWSAGSLPKRKGVVDAVRNFAFLPGPVGIWDGDWVSFGVSGITAEDVRVWPYSFSLLVKVSAFFGHFALGRLVLLNLVFGSVSFVDVLISV